MLGTLVAVALIPLGYKDLGVTGAAMALVVGEVVVWFNSWLLSRQRLHLKSHLRYLVRPVICTVSLLAVIRILRLEEIPNLCARMLASCDSKLYAAIRGFRSSRTISI